VILLISDLHLEEERPDITRAFLDLLHGRARGAQALYILGDFFEAWIGDDGNDARSSARSATALRALSDSGTDVFLMHGNRDFPDRAGRSVKRPAAPLLKDPSVVELLRRARAVDARRQPVYPRRRLHEAYGAYLRNPGNTAGCPAPPALAHPPHTGAYKLRSESRAQVPA
jgi:UDP-2,3-diacylglucosamine hydrolase